MTPGAHEYDELYVLLDDLCDGSLSEEGAARLDALLQEDPAARRQYLFYLQVHADLGVMAGKGSGFRVGAAVELPHQLEEIAKSEIPNQQIVIIDRSSPAASPLFSTLFAPGGWAFSYGVSAVVMAAAILIGLAWRVSHDYRLGGGVAMVIDSREPTAPGNRSPEAVGPRLTETDAVGRISGTMNCLWAGTNAPTGAAVLLGGKYALAAGLMEITYDSGAKVILEGPCTYDVDSATGGFLSLGKLTARVETAEVRGQRSEHYPLSTTHYPLFAVRTPTAVVTDLGTEFGVEVDEAGRTESHVFVGKVTIARVDATGSNRETTTLVAGQTARCRKGQRIVTVPASAAEPGRFVRSLQPESVRIVEKFDGSKLGAALEQMPPGRYALGRGAAVYQQPPDANDANDRESNGYIRTVATDFCDCDFVFEATIDVQYAVLDRSHLRHHVYIGIGSGEPNANNSDEMTCGLVMQFLVDTGRIHVQRRRPEWTRGSSPVSDAEVEVADFEPYSTLGSGRHRLRMVKTGDWVRFAVAANFTGRFTGDYETPPIKLSAVMPLLNSANSRLVVGTGNCDTMSVRFEDLSIVYVRAPSRPPAGSARGDPKAETETKKGGYEPMNGP